MYKIKQIKTEDRTLYNIYDVPLVSEKYPYPFAKDQEKIEYTKELIQELFDFYKEKQNSEGKHYLIIHKNHRNPGRMDIKTVGLTELTEIKEFGVFGLTIFGNLKYIDEDVFLDMKAAKLPYLSVETRDNGKKGEIYSVALLDNAEPKFCYQAFTPETLGSPSEVEKKNQKEIDEKFNMGGSMDPNTITGNPSLVNKPLSSGGSPSADAMGGGAGVTKNVAPQILSNQQPQSNQPMQQQQQIPPEDVLSIVKQIRDLLMQKEKPQMAEDKKNEKEQVEQVSSINPNYCSKRLVVLVRQFGDVEINTLEKLERAGLTDEEIGRIVAPKADIKTNQKEMFVTIGETKKEETAKDGTKFIPKTQEEKKLVEDLEIYNKKNQKNIELSKGLIEAIEKIKKTENIMEQ